MNLQLEGKNAVVCGSTQGIGLAAARELAELGASVTLFARNEAKLKEVKSSLHQRAGQSHGYVVVDFAHPHALQEAVTGFVKDKMIHILVNNTGGPNPGMASSADVEEFRIAFNSHLVCNHILATAFIPGMKSSGYGRIINVISTSVKQPLPNLGVSNTIRAAVANWAKTMANELGSFGITVNNVLPGATETSRLQSIMNSKAEKTGKAIDEIKREMESEIPMKRLGRPEEVAAAIAFLASPAAAYINGINLPVDGGRTSCL